MTDFGGKTSIFSHPVYLFLRKFSLQDSRGGSNHCRAYIWSGMNAMQLPSSCSRTFCHFLFCHQVPL
ncbi:hypothetical protein EAS69_25670 [Escherichia coli]|nr:hypothetical protein [Escherichia coli]